MDAEQVRMRASELSPQIVDVMGRHIWNYSTGLVLVAKDSQGQEYTRLIGADTFVSVSEVSGILTAAHVAKELKEPHLLGLTLNQSSHRYVIPVQHLHINIIDEAEGQDKSKGPDLAFIEIPQFHLGTIRATKSFFNISLRRDQMLFNPPPQNLGIWAVFGVPDEQTLIETPAKAFSELKGFNFLAGFGGIVHSDNAGEFDYVDFAVNYDLDPAIPKSFEGVSGGGLWHIVLQRFDNEVLEPKEFYFSGLAFFQTARSESSRIIRCHGPSSIYTHTCQSVMNSHPSPVSKRGDSAQ